MVAKKNKSTSSLDQIKRALEGDKAQPDRIGSDNLPSTQIGRRHPTEAAPSGYKAETRVMENARRDLEQSGHRKLGISVHARERLNDEPLSLEQSMDAEAASSVAQNPLLDSQRFDGYDPNVNPSIIDNPAAREEFNRERERLELQKKLRLGASPNNAKRFNPKMTPRGY